MRRWFTLESGALRAVAAITGRTYVVRRVVGERVVQRSSLDTMLYNL